MEINVQLLTMNKITIPFIFAKSILNYFTKHYQTQIFFKNKLVLNKILIIIILAWLRIAHNLLPGNFLSNYVLLYELIVVDHTCMFTRFLLQITSLTYLLSSGARFKS